MIQCLTMTSLKTKNICFLAAFLFLAIVPTLARVVDEVQDCNQFLYPPGTPPEIPGVLVGGNIQDNNRYKVICQTYEDGPNPNPNFNQRYLTVYDTKNRIPVFSAYEYKGSVRERCDVPWKIEPQLENGINLGNNMMKEVRNTMYVNQAMNRDYDENNQYYDRGHLFPAHHASTYEEQISTFTLTNAVPQHKNFNRGRWRVMETNIKNEMDLRINNFRCFVVVGAQPSNTNLNRVNIPYRMWSAVQCTNGDSGAYWDVNIARDPPVPMTMITLQQLQTDLGIIAFP